MPLNTLIIKLGAMGDVLRTTALLRVLEGDIYWVTKKECIPLLPAKDGLLKQVIDINDAEKAVKNIIFDLVLCLDDDLEAASLATLINKTKLVGSFLDTSGKLTYTDLSCEWFDMGLISKLGKENADDLKKRNSKTYQEIIFGMIGKEFKGEEYIINFDGKLKRNKKKEEMLIGIEGRVDKRWPTKQWDKYGQLGEALRRGGLRVRFFQQREKINEYINDLSECDLIITGDTLALHVSLALGIESVSIFTCTSPGEIYDYGRTVKIISPLLERAFYCREYIKEAVDAISLESVYKAVKAMIGNA
jgi:heptosyltransferase-2